MCVGGGGHTSITLIDSKADENLTDSTLVSQIGIPLQTIATPMAVKALHLLVSLTAQPL